MNIEGLEKLWVTDFKEEIEKRLSAAENNYETLEDKNSAYAKAHKTMISIFKNTLEVIETEIK